MRLRNSLLEILVTATLAHTPPCLISIDNMVGTPQDQLALLLISSLTLSPSLDHTPLHRACWTMLPDASCPQPAITWIPLFPYLPSNTQPAPLLWNRPCWVVSCCVGLDSRRLSCFFLRRLQRSSHWSRVWGWAWSRRNSCWRPWTPSQLPNLETS